MALDYFVTPPGYLKIIALFSVLGAMISFLTLLYGWGFMVFGTLMMGLCNTSLIIIFHCLGKLNERDAFYESAFSVLMTVLLFVSTILVGIYLTWTSGGIAAVIFCCFGCIAYALETFFNYKTATQA
ncbi:uncharacterized protein LOC143038423 [Oratosquilla oratoria]|uniref:uncharacterized protein LOC143038423 n=1 Tax=Oratosquilla oratoria TaxID=337810 RepID=UPI003F760F04